MKTLVASSLFLIIFGTSILAQPKPPQIKNDQPRPSGATKPSTDPAKKIEEEDGIVNVDTDLVTTPVSVLDRNGRFIPGLRKRDFKIFENGIAQKITYFQSEEQPFTVILM